MREARSSLMGSRQLSGCLPIPTACCAGSTLPCAGTPPLLKASEGSASPTSSGGESHACVTNPHEETLRADTVCVMGLMDKPRDPAVATISEVSVL